MNVSGSALQRQAAGTAGLPSPARRIIAVADRAEIRLVARCVLFARRWHLVAAARVVTRLGNGWLYPFAAALLFLTSFQSATHCLVAGAISLAVAFTIYPPLKRFVARTRPCHADRRLLNGCHPLDRYAFPSGHAMTAAAFGVPMIVAAPLIAAPIVVGGCLLVSWSRIALGHHYLSDIIAGGLIGAVIASIVAAFVL